MKEEISKDLSLLKSKLENEKKLKISEGFEKEKKRSNSTRLPKDSLDKNDELKNNKQKAPKTKNKPNIPTVNRSKTKIIENSNPREPWTNKKPEIPKFTPLPKQKSSTDKKNIPKPPENIKPVPENILKMKEYADKIR